ATVISRRRDAALVVLVMAHVALRVAAPRISANADLAAARLFARDVPIAGKSSPGGTTAIAVLPAEIAVDVATARRLADEDASRTIGSAQSAAAMVAGSAHRAIHAVVAIGGPRWRGGTRAERFAHGDGAIRRTTIAVPSTDVVRLDAEGRAELAMT